ncbi:8550_t:CDS:1, partial [Dentiscutata erythropus]
MQMASKNEHKDQLLSPKKCKKYKATNEKEQILNQLEDYKDSS